MPYSLLGRVAAKPPQPRFNNGERLGALVMILGTIAFGISGFAMWFGKGSIPASLYLAMLIIHDLAFIATFAMFIVHFYFAVIHPMTSPRQANSSRSPTLTRSRREEWPST